MKKSRKYGGGSILLKRFFASAAALCMTASLAFAAGSSEIEKWMKDYPIQEQSVVLETERAVPDLFNDARTWIIDNFTDAAKNLSTDSASNMITIPVEDVYKKGLGGTGILYFTLIVEFKDGRMRWSTRDVKLKWVSSYYEYYSTHETGYDGNKTSGGFKPYRKEGSETYQKYIARIAEGMQKVANGDLGSSDW